MKIYNFSVVTSVSVTTNKEKTSSHISEKSQERKRVIPSSDLPVSPAVLLRPDKFQFYTFNQKGDVITKQMTEQQIQSLIAAGGGHLPLELHEPQKAGEVPSGGLKVKLKKIQDLYEHFFFFFDKREG